jgi:hypothetical protein
VTKGVPWSRLRDFGHYHFRLINHGRRVRPLHETSAEQLPRDIVVGIELLAHGYDTVIAGQLPVCYQSHILKSPGVGPDRPRTIRPQGYWAYAGLVVKEPLI